MDDDVKRYFEFGTSPSALDETLRLSGTTDETGSFSLTVKNLKEDKKYYFRACIALDDDDAYI